MIVPLRELSRVDKFVLFVTKFNISNIEKVIRLTKKLV